MKRVMVGIRSGMEAAVVRRLTSQQRSQRRVLAGVERGMRRVGCGMECVVGRVRVRVEGRVGRVGCRMRRVMDGVLLSLEVGTVRCLAVVEPSVQCVRRGVERCVVGRLCREQCRQLGPLRSLEGIAIGLLGCVKGLMRGFLDGMQRVMRRVGDSMERCVRCIERVMESSGMPRIEKRVDCHFHIGIYPKLFMEFVMKIHTEQVVEKCMKFCM